MTATQNTTAPTHSAQAWVHESIIDFEREPAVMFNAGASPQALMSYANGNAHLALQMLRGIVVGSATMDAKTMAGIAGGALALLQPVEPALELAIRGLDS